MGGNCGERERNCPSGIKFRDLSRKRVTQLFPSVGFNPALGLEAGGGNAWERPRQGLVLAFTGPSQGRPGEGTWSLCAVWSKKSPLQSSNNSTTRPTVCLWESSASQEWPPARTEDLCLLFGCPLRKVCSVLPGPCWVFLVVSVARENVPSGSMFPSQLAFRQLLDQSQKLVCANK